MATMIPSSYNYGPLDRGVDVTTPQASTSRPRSGDAKWDKAYSQGAERGRQMAAARGNVSKGQEK
jgi:hypothetical protein